MNFHKSINYSPKIGKNKLMNMNTLLATPVAVINQPATPGTRNIVTAPFYVIIYVLFLYLALFYEKNNAIAAIPVIRADQVRPTHEIKPEPIITDSSFPKY